MTGADIRRYRRAIGWNQQAFAQELGLSQSALSLIEGGKVAVSEEHLTRLSKVFDAAKFKPRLGEFLKELEHVRSEGQAALDAPLGGHVVLPVWAWQDDFELNRPPKPEQAMGLITIRATAGAVIAFQMDKATEAWEKGEILAFERCDRQDVRDGDLCLLQVKPPRARGSKTIVARAHLAPIARGRALQLEPVSPKGPIFTPEEDVAWLRVVFRGRYVQSWNGPES